MIELLNLQTFNLYLTSLGLGHMRLQLDLASFNSFPVSSLLNFGLQPHSASCCNLYVILSFRYQLNPKLQVFCINLTHPNAC